MIPICARPRIRISAFCALSICCFWSAPASLALSHISQTIGRMLASNPVMVRFPSSYEIGFRAPTYNSSAMNGLSVPGAKKSGKRAPCSRWAVLRRLDAPLLEPSKAFVRPVSLMTRVPSSRTAHGIDVSPIISSPLWVAFIVFSDIGLDSYCSGDCEIEQSGILAMVVAITELGNVLMQMAESDFVILAEDAAFQQAPKSFNGVGMNLAIGIREFMVDRAVWHEALDSDIALVLVRDENRIVAINVLPNEFRDALVSQFFLVDWHRNDSPASLYDPDHRGFVGATSAAQILFPATRWPIALARVSADVGFQYG